MVQRINKDSILILKKFELIYLSLSINLLLFRIALPFLEYLFVPAAILLGFYFVYIFLQTRDRFILIKEYIRTFHIFILTGMVYLIPLTYTNDYTVLVFRESLTVLYFIFLTLTFFFIIQSDEQFQYFLKEFLKQILIISVLSTILGLTKFILHLYGIDLQFLAKNGLYPEGTSLKLDHNFYSLTSFFGILLIIWKLQKPLQKRIYIVYQLLIFLFTINIFYSTSRRGFFLLAIFIILLVVSVLFNKTKLVLIKKFHTVLKRMNLYLLLTLLFIASNILFIWGINPETKLKIMRITGIQTWTIKNEITNALFDYLTIFTRKIDINQLNNQIWSYHFDPKDPASGWANYNYIPEFPLEGKGSENIPKGTIGYKLDRTSLGTFWQGSFYSITPIGDTYINHQEAILASVYCYVSGEYNGGPVSISASGEIYGKAVHEYDLDVRNTWQKLDIMFRGRNSSRISLSLRFYKDGVNSFDSLSGYVIFAYPVFSVVKTDPKNPDSGWGYLKHTTVFPLKGEGVEVIPPGTKGYKLNHTVNGYFIKTKAVAATTIERVQLEIGENATAQVFCYVSEDFDGAQVAIGSEGGYSKGDIRHEYNLLKKGTWQLLDINFIAIRQEVPIFLVFTRLESENFRNLKGYVIFAYPEIRKSLNTDTTSFFPKRIQTGSGKKYLPGGVGMINYIISEKNIILSLMNIFMHKQTIESDSLVITPSKNVLAGGRIDRWRFAYQYFKKEHNTYEKLFGGGFDYLQAYSITFFNDPEHMDYPHNTLISSVLYSGILGGIIYLVFLLFSFYYGFKYRQHHGMFLIFYLLTFFFVFFSSNSHFELPLFTFLSIVPFFTHYIILKEKKRTK